MFFYEKSWVLNWDEIVEDLGPRLYRYFCVRFESHMADDLTQETLVRLVQKVHEGKFDPLKGTLTMLAFGIAHYVVCEAKSEHSISHQTQLLDLDYQASDQDLEHDILSKDRAKTVRKHFHKLNNTEQQVMSLAIDEELNLKQIAAILDIPEGTVKSHVSRAKKKLIQMINKEFLI